MVYFISTHKKQTIDFAALQKWFLYPMTCPSTQTDESVPCASTELSNSAQVGFCLTTSNFRLQLAAVEHYVLLEHQGATLAEPTPPFPWVWIRLGLVFWYIFLCNTKQSFSSCVCRYIGLTRSCSSYSCFNLAHSVNRICFRITGAQLKNIFFSLHNFILCPHTEEVFVLLFFLNLTFLSVMQWKNN